MKCDYVKCVAERGRGGEAAARKESPMKRKQIREKTKFICDSDSIYNLRCTYVYTMDMTI
jgi:hypothetical protein